jgi:hypothetical protein
MFTPTALVALAGVVMAGSMAAQTKTAAGPKMVVYDMVVNADVVYTGTMEIGVEKGKVTGKIHVTAPEEVIGEVAGTEKDNVLSLDFPYSMPQRSCDGAVRMTITLPPKPGPATGTLEVIGCGRDPSEPLTGTVELTPAAEKKK